MHDIMALNNRTNSPRIFLGIAYGKITHRVQGQETPETYTDVEGHLKDIIIRNAEIKGVPTPFMDLIIEDGADTYNLSVQLNSGVARSIILSLASVQNFIGNTVRINPYLSKDGEHTNIAVYVNNQKVSWVVEPSQIPALEYVQVGSQKVADDTKRSKFINQHVLLLQKRLKDAQATPQAQAQENYGMGESGEDLPADEDVFADGSQHL